MTRWLYWKIPFYVVMPALGFALADLFPTDWPEWRGGAILAGFGLYAWGFAGPRPQGDE